MTRLGHSACLIGVLAAACLLAPAIAPAEAESERAFQGSAALGGHRSEVEDWVGKVREFDLGREEIQPDMWVDFHGHSGANRLDVFFRYWDEQTMEMRAKVRGGRVVTSEHDYRAFHHGLDHDRLANMQWRELAGYTEEMTPRPGGKMITHEDRDPTGVYGIRYSDATHGITVRPPQFPGARVAVSYREQTRSGTRQLTAVDHCSNCHVKADRGTVNEQTRDLRAGLSTVVSALSVDYDFSTRTYDNMALPPTTEYMRAQHPLFGGAGDSLNAGDIADGDRAWDREFSSRSIYSGQTLPYAKAPDVSKQGHTLRVKADLPGSQSLRGSFAYTTTENTDTANELTGSAATIGWHARPTPRLRLAASAAHRRIENDDVRIDLPSWREGSFIGGPGGQSFDWTRASAYDREEYVATASLSYAVAARQHLKLDYRFRSTDRQNVRLDPDLPDETTTLQNRIRGAWIGRFAKGLRSRISGEYELTDHPFVNVGGICEVRGDTLAHLPGNAWVYYFQRERVGTGGNLPTQAVRAKAHLGYSAGPRLSFTAYVNFTTEKNDELGRADGLFAYEWERTILGPGAAVTVMPGAGLALSTGAAYSKIESNAKACVPVMDG